MKTHELSVQQMLAWRGMIDKGVSLGVVTLDNGKQYAVKSVTEYVAGWLGKLQNGEMLIQKNQAAPGLRSITGNKLPVGVTQLITDVRFLLDTTLVGETDANLILCPFASAAPPLFKSGEFRIIQNQELHRSSNTDMTNFKASTGNDADFKTIAPVVLRPQVNTSFNLTLADVAPANAAYKFEYRALEFTEIAQA